MESKGAPTPTRVYQDFEPSMEWVPEDDSDTLLIYLPGFAKEQLRVQLRARNLIISGERKLHQNTWSRFSVQFPVSGNCDLNKISAKFEGNILFVRQPKLITPAANPEEAKPVAPPKPVDEPNVAKKTTTEVKPTPTPTPMIQSNIEKKEVVKDKDHLKTGVEEKGEKSEGKTREEGVCENESKKKTSEWEADKNVLESYKRTAGALATKLKTSANGVNTIAIVVVGIVIGIYVSNSIKSWTNA